MHGMSPGNPRLRRTYLIYEQLRYLASSAHACNMDEKYYPANLIDMVKTVIRMRVLPFAAAPDFSRCRR
ncbi:protein of unknown function [Aminobacter niigataensis]|nr:protein of unknown function [Aminobacter niigataensis]